VKPVRLVWFVWVRRRGQGALRKQDSNSSGSRRQGLEPGGRFLTTSQRSDSSPPEQRNGGTPKHGRSR
jgi:hypothetical protein